MKFLGDLLGFLNFPVSQYLESFQQFCHQTDLACLCPALIDASHSDKPAPLHSKTLVVRAGEVTDLHLSASVHQAAQLGWVSFPRSP